MDSHHSCDILVVGAGVFGLTAAIELKSRHKDKKITVIDNGPIPHRHAASTDISKVIRMDYGDDELYVEMMVRSRLIKANTGLLFFVRNLPPDLFCRRSAFPSGGSGIKSGRNKSISKPDLCV